MNPLLPSVPAKAHGPAGLGDGLQARREIPEGDFAAALADTAGDAGGEAKSRGARAEKSDAAARLLRAVRRLDAREPRADPNDKVTLLHAGTPREADAALRSKSARRSEGEVDLPKAEPKELDEVLPAEGGKVVPAAPGAAAREVLAVLGVDLVGKPERMAAGPELGASIRMAAGPRGMDTDARGAGKAVETDFGDEAEIEVLPVRVMREEKHFRPAGVEAQRWQGAQNLRQDAGVAASILPADTKATPPEPIPRDRLAVPPEQARSVEVATPMAQPALVTGEVPTGTVGVQIAERVQQALGAPAEPGAPPPPAGANHEPDTRQVFAPAIRTIKLQLNPASLGTVTIVLSGNDDGLRIHLAAELPDTVMQVENDRGALAARLSGAGYSVTEVSVARLGAQGMEGDARDQSARQGSTHEQFGGNASREGGTPFGRQNQTGRHFGDHEPHAETGAGAIRGAADAPVIAGVSYGARFRPV